MIREYDIPNGTKLYFGASAKKKRRIEAACAQFFESAGYEEISTPYFSYHQNLDAKDLIRLSDENNNSLSLRGDSTLEAVRIIEKRLGRTTDHQKWFYIQPVFAYPSCETNQIGAEWIGCSDITLMANEAARLLKLLGLGAHLQIGNLSLPKLIAGELNISIELFYNQDFASLEALGIDWLNRLIAATSAADLKALAPALPSSISSELASLLLIYENIDWEQRIISPLYTTKLKYYDNLFFRFISGSSKIATGGVYTTQGGQKATGFAIYTDNIIAYARGAL